MELNEQEHKGCVKSRIHDTCLVQEPVEVTIEGKATSLSLMDAKLLLAGLKEAIAVVEASEANLVGDDGLRHAFILAPTRSGMSLPRTKLGQGGIVYRDGMPDADLYRKLFDISDSDVRAISGLPAAGQRS